MPSNTSRIDLLLQYALLVAGEEDEFFDRQLGPIHLIKYVYLADLAYAKRNAGETFTGMAIGGSTSLAPWYQTVNERIEPALCAISAAKQTFPSDYDDKNDSGFVGVCEMSTCFGKRSGSSRPALRCT